MDTEAFITRTSNYSHYEFINKDISEFANWRNDNNLFYKYVDFILNKSDCPTLKIDYEIPYEDMYNEAISNWHRLVPHRVNDGLGWKSMCIHGTKTEETNTWETASYNYSSQPTHTWTDLADTCPKTKEWLMSFPCVNYQRVRFMILEPGGYITVHRDKDYRKISAINIALNNPENFYFYMEDAGHVPWNPGDIRLIDNGRYHALKNNGKDYRVHFIIHADWKYELLKLACESYDKLVYAL